MGVPGEEAPHPADPRSLVDEGTAGRAGTACPTRLEVGRAGRSTLLGGSHTALEACEVIRGAPASRRAGPRLRHHALGACGQVLTASAEAAVRRRSWRWRLRLAAPQTRDVIRLTAGLGGPRRGHACAHTCAQGGRLGIRAAVLLAGELVQAVRLQARLLLEATPRRARRCCRRLRRGNDRQGDEETEGDDSESVQHDRGFLSVESVLVWPCAERGARETALWPHSR